MVVGEFTTETDLAVIGGGPAGYSAAFRAAEIGLETTIVDERPALGGSWLHDGCMPSKELLRVVRLLREARDAERIGVVFGEPRIDLDRVRARLRATSESASKALDERCEALGVTVLRGRARFDDARSLSIADCPAAPRLRFRKTIIATGTRDRMPPGLTLFPGRTWTTAEAFALDCVPASLLVIGGNASALELATIYAALGSRVTLATDASELLPRVDRDLTQVLHARLERDFEAIHLGAAIGSIAAQKDAIAVEIAGKRCTFDRAIIAAGREANTVGLGLERTRVALDDAGFVVVDSHMRTSEPRILAAGDICGGEMLAVSAAHQGRVAAEAAAGWGTTFDARATPVVLFTDPPIAWCGLSETSARDENVPYRVTAARWAAASAHDEGCTRVIYDPETQLVLGVGIVGAGAPELIAEAALAIEMGAVLDDLASTLHPHPTACEHLSTAAGSVTTKRPTEN